MTRQAMSKVSDILDKHLVDIKAGHGHLICEQLLKDLLRLLPKEHHHASRGYNNGWNDYRDQVEQVIREYLS